MRQRNTLGRTKEEIREELLKELAEPIPESSLPEHKRDIYVLHPECPYAKESGKVVESRYVWWLNHPDDRIRPNEVIHHINLNRQDNRIENLVKRIAPGHSKSPVRHERKCGWCKSAKKRDAGWFCNHWLGYIEEIRVTRKLQLPCGKFTSFK